MKQRRGLALPMSTSIFLIQLSRPVKNFTVCEPPHEFRHTRDVGPQLDRFGTGDKHLNVNTTALQSLNPMRPDAIPVSIPPRIGPQPFFAASPTILNDSSRNCVAVASAGAPINKS